MLRFFAFVTSPLLLFASSPAATTGEVLTLEQVLLDAGIVRLRPVMITIGATVTALGPLAVHGGPLWQPLCFAQMGGLLVATFVTLLLVPVVFSIFVLDLKLIQWPGRETVTAPSPQPA